MEEEIRSLYKNDTWKLVDKPKGQKIIGCKWVYRKNKAIPRVENERFKAKLVAKRFTQNEGIDFNEIFSPVVKHRSIRILLSLVAEFDYELEQIDVKTTFLYGKLEEKIYMQQPEDFEVKGKEDQVCLLKRSLYGLKQSPRQWNKRFNCWLGPLGQLVCSLVYWESRNQAGDLLEVWFIN